MTTWTYLSNHSHVLICLARNKNARLREVAIEVGITERAVQRIVAELADAEVIVRSREGRRNRYEVNLDQPLRHPVEGGSTVRDLLRGVLADIDQASPPAKAKSNGRRPSERAPSASAPHNGAAKSNGHARRS